MEKAEVIKMINCRKQPHSWALENKGKRSELPKRGFEEGPHRIRIQPLRRGHHLAVAGIST